MLNQSKVESSVRVRITYENVAGVTLPRMRAVRPGTVETQASLGLAGGGYEIERTQRKWSKQIDNLIQLAGLQYEFQALDEAIVLTSRRVNALENVLIPRMTDIIAYILSELDELEREEIFRIKKVLEVKRKHLAQEAAQYAAEAADRHVPDAAAMEAAGEADLLGIGEAAAGGGGAAAGVDEEDEVDLLGEFK